jgi:hypothetical protein
LRGCAFLRHAAKNGIHEAGVTGRTPVGLRETHRQIDGGVIGDFEPENLGCPKQEDRFGTRCVGRKSLFEESSNQMAKRAEPPQDCRGKATRQRAVAFGKRR